MLWPYLGLSMAFFCPLTLKFQNRKMPFLGIKSNIRAIFLFSNPHRKIHTSNFKSLGKKCVHKIAKKICKIKARIPRMELMPTAFEQFYG